MSARGGSLQVITNSPGREVQVTSVDVPAMDEGQTTLPVEMIPFINTPVAQPFINGRNAGLIGSLALSVLLFVVLSLLTSSTKFALGLASATLVLNATVLLLRFRSHASTPLAVNLNHPFMEGEPLGDAAVMVRLSDGTWRDPGPHRVRLIPDELLGGFSLAQDTMDFPVVGHFTSTKDRTPTIVRHLALINQAIGLRDAVNDVPDPIEDARAREKIESGLLERSWFEEEKEIEVESPLVSFFRGKE